MSDIVATPRVGRSDEKPADSASIRWFAVGGPRSLAFASMRPDRRRARGWM